MNSSVLALLIFAALTAGIVAAVLAVRDLFLSGRKGKQREEPLRLHRLPRESDQNANGAVASFDRWFVRLVRETGTGWSTTEAALLLILCGVVVGAALFLFSEHPVVSVLGVCIGMGAALTYLSNRRRKHIRLLQDQLPGALDMLARSVRAGRSIDDAIQLAGDQLPIPLSKEFQFCANQMSLGLALPAVMRSLVDRVGLFDVKIFTTTLTVHRQAGGNLAKVLTRLAAVIRDRLNSRRQLRSTTGAGRFSAMLIAAIGPLLFVYMFFFHPNYVKAMLESPLGQTMLIAAFVLEAIGIIWTARLLKPIY